MDTETINTLKILEESVSGMEEMTSGPYGPFSKNWLTSAFIENTRSGIEHCLTVLVQVTNSMVANADDLTNLAEKYPHEHQIKNLKKRYHASITHLMSMVDMLEEWYNQRT